MYEVIIIKMADHAQHPTIVCELYIGITIFSWHTVSALTRAKEFHVWQSSMVKGHRATKCWHNHW